MVSTMRTTALIILAISIGVIMVSIIPSQLTSPQFISIIDKNYQGPPIGGASNTATKTDTTTLAIPKTPEALANRLALDINYYSILALNLLVAFTVYFVARKRFS